MSYRVSVIKFKTHVAENALEALCWAHKQKGGTIHDFSRLYGVDLTRLRPGYFLCREHKKYGRDVVAFWENGRAALLPGTPGTECAHNMDNARVCLLSGFHNK